ncbi:MAG: rhomboid family intramembrane serine protease [Chitinophagaceae bacterium]
MTVREEKSRRKITLGEDGNSLVNLLIFNAIIFALLKFILLIYKISDFNLDAYYTNIFNWFTLPGSIGKLATRPWVIVTHMFTHDGLLHFIGNMLWLWSFGYILQDVTGNSKMVPIYLYGGFAGAFFYVLFHSLFPGMAMDSSGLLGANAAVMAIAVATTTVAPNYRIFPMINGGIPLWILTLIYAMLDFGFLPRNDMGTYIAHFAGACIGFLFIYQMRKGSDWSEWMNSFFLWVGNLFNPDAKKNIINPREQHFYKVKDAQPFKKTPNVTQKRIDDILDKINQKGFHFLTDEEKDILKRAAKEDDV